VKPNRPDTPARRRLRTPFAGIRDEAVFTPARRLAYSPVLLSIMILCTGASQRTYPKRTPAATPHAAPSVTTAPALQPLALIIGGTGLLKVPSGESPAVLATAEIYSPRANVAIPVSPMTTSRSHQSAVSLPDGDVLIVGGVNALFVPLLSGPTVPWILSSTDVFDVARGRFIAGVNMIVERDSPSATMLTNGKVLVLGGGTNCAELYDPDTGKFTATGPMEAERYGQTATLLTNGKVLVVGGGSTQAELFDPGIGKFSPAGMMEQNRDFHTATLLLDGRVLIAGGSPYARSSATDTTELYDPLNGVFEPGPKMLKSRAGHTATLMTNSQVLIAGGHDDNSAEIYDPVAEQFNATGNMSVSRFGHSATRWPDGKVLIAGGWNKSYQPLAATETYDPKSGEFTPGANMTEPRADHTTTMIWAPWPISWAKPTPMATPTASVISTASPTPTAAPTTNPLATLAHRATPVPSAGAL
jgi:hypothetical protein